MKGLSIEEKAKAYDKAIERAKSKIKNDKDHVLYEDDVIEIFPELRESEDEIIRKELIKGISKTRPNTLFLDTNITREDALAWLEKQGEHANFRNKIQIGDKVTRNEDGVLVNLSQLKRVAKKDEKQGEQKPLGFNIGDEITVNGQICKVVAVEQKPTYTKEYDFHGMKFIPKFAKGDIIKDKKRGEVSTIEDFSYDTGLYTHTYGQFPITIQDNYEIIEQNPADKVERKGMNLVEEEMTPFQKKVFCIIDTTIEEEQGLKQVCDELLRLAHDEIMQKSAWSEEDESMLQNILECLKNGWRKLPTDILKYESWLKSLRPYLQWKPSELQLECLDDAIKHYQLNGSRPVILMELLEELKKL